MDSTFPEVSLFDIIVSRFRKTASEQEKDTGRFEESRKLWYHGITKTKTLKGENTDGIQSG
jgi:hypothetical protein